MRSFISAPCRSRRGSQPKRSRPSRECARSIRARRRPSRRTSRSANCSPRSTPKRRLPELEDFLKKYPQEHAGRAGADGAGHRAGRDGPGRRRAGYLQEAARRSFRRAKPRHTPTSSARRFSSGQQKFDEVPRGDEGIQRRSIPTVRRSIEAYDFTAQILTSQGKGPEAIAVYDDFVAKRPNDPRRNCRRRRCSS